MKNNKHIESFGKFNENLNISDVRSSKKDEVYNFIKWLSENNKYKKFEEGGEIKFLDALSNKKYSFDQIYDFYRNYMDYYEID